MLDLEELINIQIHFSPSLIRSQRKNATSLNYILHLLNNRNRIKKNPVSWEGWMLVSDPELGLLMRALHGLAGGSEGGLPATAGAWGHLQLSWAGLGSCQAGICGPKPGRALCSSVERYQGRGSLGRWVSSFLTSARSGFLPGREHFGRGTGWTDAPSLPGSASGEVPSFSRSVSSLALKIRL